ncbi:MAG: hypothetical protein JSW50_11280 [Candidatus Latescibacterota bacterium]|nr:MAG: hypothetical protein JSW50_11280 [Candidatus Latescibacterota bacterium]
MIGTFLFLILFLAIARYLRGWPPAARVGFAAALSLAVPVVVLSILARFGFHATSISIAAVFVVLIAVILVRTPRGFILSDDPAWVTTAAVALLVAMSTALFGRPPTMDPLVDPWAHLAWSRDLPNAFHLYSTGFPAFYAVMGLGDPLAGAFRFAPMLLHAALAAQFMALSERFGKPWTGAVAAFVFLVVPVAFGKFEPPRPILLASVFIAASWWIILFDRPGFRWKMGSLAFLTGALVITHASVLEITHLAALAFAIQIGDDSVTRTSRFGVVLTVAGAAVFGLIISPFPLWLFFKPDAGAAVVDMSRPIDVPGVVDFARMWGLGLGVAAAAASVWMIVHVRTAWRASWGVLPGFALWFVLCLAPVGLAGLGVRIPNTLAAYRYVLAASLPLALAAAVVGAMTAERSKAASIVVLLCSLVVGVDIALRPSFQLLYGLIAAALVATTWRIVNRPSKPAIPVALSVGCLALATAFRLVIWFPTTPPEASWLKEEGDPNFHVITNWPVTNSLDALAPQPVLDGLAGKDANLGLHRASATTSLRDCISWCGQNVAANADSLHTALQQANALPAYIVVGNRFEQAWRTYAEQRAKRPGTSSFFAASPCADDPVIRLLNIRRALENHPTVTHEFETETVTIYTIR